MAAGDRRNVVDDDDYDGRMDGVVEVDKKNKLQVDTEEDACGGRDVPFVVMDDDDVVVVGNDNK